MDMSQVAAILAVVTSLVSLMANVAVIAYIFGILKAEVTQLKTDAEKFKAHIADGSVHHNNPAFREFEKRIEGELSAIKGQIHEVKEYCEEIDKKLDRGLRGLS